MALQDTLDDIVVRKGPREPVASDRRNIDESASHKLRLLTVLAQRAHWFPFMYIPVNFATIQGLNDLRVACKARESR